MQNLVFNQLDVKMYHNRLFKNTKLGTVTGTVDTA